MSTHEDSRERAEARLGRTLEGRFQLERILALGGSAWVYVARDLNAGGQVAVKVLHAPLAAYAIIVRRFLGEAQVANVVQHRGVVRLLASGMLPGEMVPYLVTELLAGETLEERRVRKGGRLGASEVLWAADRTLSILAKAHAKGVLHRDVKPENLFLTDNRELKLLDFGIARIPKRVSNMPTQPGFPSPSVPPPSSDEYDEPAPETRVGVTLGTVDFMPPEQAKGDWGNVEVRTDLWAVGATMFTLLSGRTVHDEEDFTRQLEAVSTKPAPSIGSIVRDLHKDVVGVVDQALSFDVARRWTTATAMRFAILVAYSTMTAPPDSGEIDSDREVPEPMMHDGPEPPPLSIRRPG